MIGGFYTWHLKDWPQGLAGPRHTPGKRPGLVRTGEGLGPQRRATRLPRSPLAHCGARRPPRAPSVERRVYACPKARQACRQTLRAPCGRAEPLGYATLPYPGPGVRAPLPVADAEAAPRRCPQAAWERVGDIWP
jgi:hypothetical protein